MTTHDDRPAAPSEGAAAEPMPAESAATDPAPEPTPAPAAAAEPSATASPADVRLVPEDAVMDFQARWEAIQQGFVDDPRTAVTDADALVGAVLQRLSTTFEDQHRELEHQWTEGEPSTEDLRSALQRYRTFFDRLLSI